MEKPSEKTGLSEAASELAGAQSAEQKTAELVQKHRRGRPPGSRNKPGRPRKAPAVADDSAPGEGVAPAEAGAGIREAASIRLDIELLKKTGAKIIDGVDFTLARFVYWRSRRIGCDKEVAGEIFSECRLPPAESEAWGEALAALAAKHGWEIWAPELVIVGLLAAMGTRYGMILSKLNDIEAQFKEALKKSKETRDAVKSPPD